MLQHAGYQDLDQTRAAEAARQLGLRLRADGRLDRARAEFERADITGDEIALFHYLRTLFDLEDYAAFQDALIRAIGRLDQLSSPTSEYLCFLLHFSERACLSEEVIERLLAQIRQSYRLDERLRQTWAAVKHRQKFRQQLRSVLSTPITLISLGLHCLPWTLANRWGFRTTSQFAGTFNPFCLAVHKIEGVISALQSEFKQYACSENLTTVKTTNGHAVAMRRDRAAVWNHNKGMHWIEEDYQRLIENLQMKAGSFLGNCRSEHPVFLLGNCLVNHPEEPLDFLPELQAALTHVTGRDKNHLIITNQRHQPSAEREFQLDSHTMFFYCPYPDRAYVWHDDDTADSKPGLIYERSYAVSIRRCLARWRLARGINAPAHSE